MTGFYYLASAYSHPDPDIRELRFQQAQSGAALLLSKRIWVYCPIMHIHELAKRHKLPFEFEFWNEYNQAMIRASNGLIRLKNYGWEQSRGMTAEITFCALIGKQVLDLNQEMELVPLQRL